MASQHDNKDVLSSSTRDEQVDGQRSRTKIKELLIKDKQLLQEIVLESVSVKTMQSWLAQKYRQSKENGHSTSDLNSRYSTTNMQDLEKYLLSEAKVDLTLCKHFHSSHNLLRDACKIIGMSTSAENVILYSVENDTSFKKDFCWSSNADRDQTEHGVSDVVKNVAKTRTALFIPTSSGTMCGKGKFREQDTTDTSFICLPVVSPNGYLSGVIEVSRTRDSIPFTTYDFQVANSTVALACVALHQAAENKVLSTHRDLNNFLILVTKKMFNEIVKFDDLLVTIVTYTKTLVSAECCSIFMLDAHGNMRAELFDEQEKDEKGNSVYSKKKYEIKFPKRRGIAGFVAETGEIANVKNARDDERFLPEIDQMTGYVTVSVLAVPILQANEVIGVVEATNKTFGSGFTEGDEETLKKFAMHFSLAVNFSKTREMMRRRESEATIAKEQFLYHSCFTSRANRKSLLLKPVPDQIPDEFEQFSFFPRGFQGNLPQLFIYMVFRRFGEEKFDLAKLSSFILAVRKNYRDVPYHNWEHGFQVTHCMYWFLQSLQGNVLTEFEAMGFLFACICHDVDHRGYNNTFCQKFDQPLAALYSSSVMEQHHYQTTLLILQANNVFKFLDRGEYAKMLEEIRHAIIATDLALYFPNQQRVRALLDDNEFDIRDPGHRYMAKSLLMTGCDLVGACKDWADQVTTVKKLYDEFYIQGDIEKEKGFDPLPFMDRCQKSNLATQQHQFLKYVCKPLYSTLADIFPTSNPLAEAVYENMEKWQRIEDGEQILPWNDEILNVIGKDKKWIFAPGSEVDDNDTGEESDRFSP